MNPLRFHSVYKTFHIGILIIFLFYSLFLPLAAYAGSLNVGITLSTYAASTPTSITLTFTLVNAIMANGYINIHFPTGTTMESGLDYTDVDVLVNGSNRTLGAYTGPSFTGYDAISINNTDPNNLLFQIVPDSEGAGYAVEDSFTVKIGTNATYQHTGDKQYINGSAGVATYQVISKNVSNETIDSGSKNITIIASAPEFGTIAYITALAGGAWLVFRKLQQANGFSA